MSANLRARNSISLLAEPVSWGELSVIEMVLAVNPEGLIIMANEAGEISNGQRIEDFAIALKRGTGAKYADFEGVDAESGEPITDEALEYPTGGRSVLLGSVRESEVALVAGTSKTTWNVFGTEHGNVAVHEGYMPEITISRSEYPAIMLSRLGPRFSMVFWFEGQSKKLHGYPGFGHGWSVAADPVLVTVPGSAAEQVTGFLTREWLAPDLESIAKLSEYNIDENIIAQLGDALSGCGSINKLRTVLEIFGHPGSLAEYAEEGTQPDSARQVAPRGMGSTMAGSIGAQLRSDAQEATGLRKLLNPIAWLPRHQILWGIVEGMIAAALVILSDWRQPWMPLWVPLVVALLWGIDALINVVVGARRWSKKRQQRI